jgi:hypothetical protein
LPPRRARQPGGDLGQVELDSGHPVPARRGAAAGRAPVPRIMMSPAVARVPAGR